jgi:hypothetical protein
MGYPRERTKGLFSVAQQKKDRSKLNERPANVYENKGALWKARELSGNVYENTGT